MHQDCRRQEERRIPESELKKLLGINEADVSKRVAVYARVSSYDQKQKGDLERQKQSLLDMQNQKAKSLQPWT
ncbi:MAG: hypothetical protein QXR69_00505 [Conexivisphaerales archaeon]